MVGEPRILVVDGYKKPAREELAAGGATPAGPLYAAMLTRCHPGCTVDVVYPADPDSSLPHGAGLNHYDGIAWTGSSLTAYRDEPAVRVQIEFARAAFEAGLPSFGSCWAAQIGVAAAGGRCAANPRGREMGIARKIALTPEGRAHPLFFGKASVFDAFISHEDEITHLPPGAINLASNAFTRVQAVSVVHRGGTLWALQYHPEYDLHELGPCTRMNEDVRLADPGFERVHAGAGSVGSPDLRGTLWALQYHPEYDLHELARLTWCRIDKLVGLGFFQDREAAEAYVDRLEALHQDPSRRDIAWLLGIDADVMNEDVRLAEVRNWLQHLVLPNMRR